MKVQDRGLLLLSTFLASLSGFMNALGILIFSIPVSHFTGNVTKSSIAFMHGDYYTFLNIFLGIVFFLLGNIISGYILGEKEFSPNKRYGIMLIFIGIILLFDYNFIEVDSVFVKILSFLCGLQNGLFITYKGMTVRMTHITGGLTDMGVLIGNYLNKRHNEVWKIKFYLLLIIGFFIGGTIGAISFYKFGREAFIIVSIGYLSSGYLYFIWRSRGIRNSIFIEITN